MDHIAGEQPGVGTGARSGPHSTSPAKTGQVPVPHLASFLRAERPRTAESATGHNDVNRAILAYISLTRRT